MYKYTMVHQTQQNFIMFIIVLGDGLGMWRLRVRRGGCMGSSWENRREGDYWGDLDVVVWIILVWISRR